jgi:hypothetical protein
MPDHLSIEVLGVLRGSADGPLAVALLGSVTLAALLIIIGRPLLQFVAARMVIRLTRRKIVKANPYRPPHASHTGVRETEKRPRRGNQHRP